MRWTPGGVATTSTTIEARAVAAGHSTLEIFTWALVDF